MSAKVKPSIKLQGIQQGISKSCIHGLFKVLTQTSTDVTLNTVQTEQTFSRTWIEIQPFYPFLCTDPFQFCGKHLVDLSILL